MTVRLALLALPVLQIVPDWTAAGEGEFGRSLAVLDADGDGFGDLLVGAPGRDSAFLFPGSAGGPATAAAWTVSGGPRFGDHVASAGDVNGDGFEDAVVADLERTFLFLGSAAGPATAAAWTVPGSVPAGIGDVNGDGFGDLAVGHPSDPAGGVAVYLGSASGPSTEPVWRVAGHAQASSQFGAAIAAAGDVDGDGFDDFLIGAPRQDLIFGTVDIDVVYYIDDVLEPADLPIQAGVVPDTGRAFLIAGSSGGPERMPRWSAIGSPIAREGFGIRVAGGSDVNADGRPDAVVASGRSEAVAFFARGSGLSFGPDWTRTGRQIDAETPMAVGMGDVNGDGVGDLVVVDRVSLSVFEGPALTSGPSWNTEDNAFVTFDAVLAVGDLNGDGLDDLATAGNGEVRVFLGRAAAAPPATEDPAPAPPVVAATGPDERSSSDGCGLLGAEAWLALAYLSSRMRRPRNQTSSP